MTAGLTMQSDSESQKGQHSTLSADQCPSINPYLSKKEM